MVESEEDNYVVASSGSPFSALPINPRKEDVLEGGGGSIGKTFLSFPYHCSYYYFSTVSVMIV